MNSISVETLIVQVKIVSADTGESTQGVFFVMWTSVKLEVDWKAKYNLLGKGRESLCPHLPERWQTVMEEYLGSICSCYVLPFFILGFNTSLGLGDSVI